MESLDLSGLDELLDVLSRFENIEIDLKRLVGNIHDIVQTTEMQQQDSLILSKHFNFFVYFSFFHHLHRKQIK